MNPSNQGRARKTAANPTSHCFIHLRGIRIQSTMWSGRQMDMCLLQGQELILFAYGMDKQEGFCRPSSGMEDVSIVWSGRRMVLCWHQARMTQPFAYGMDRQGGICRLSRGMKVQSIV